MTSDAARAERTGNHMERGDAIPRVCEEKSVEGHKEQASNAENWMVKKARPDRYMHTFRMPRSHVSIDEISASTRYTE